MIRRPWSAFALAAMGALLVSPAWALTPQQVDQCRSSTDLKLRVASCTAVIESGNWPEKDLAWAFNNRGVGYRELGELDRALEDYTRSLRIDPTNADEHYNLGLIYVLKHNYDRAIAEITKAIDGYDPKRWTIDFKRDYYKDRGIAYGLKGDLDSAINDYNSALAIDPKYAAAYYLRSLARDSKGDKAGSEADLALAKKLQPGIGGE
jgi:tetratricopeptide (TPR) repeat protein